MEGILYKWTNYMTGWQPRWFVLQNGEISYYDSEDDVRKGSKGSIKMSVCEIKVHSTDPARLELIIPGEQHFYVRAVNAAERQRWLVALGSSKAGTLDSHKHKGPDCLKTKMSEVRLYCDLLVQQVQTIQSQHSIDTPVSSTSESSLLSATCSTFLRTLEECMVLANQTLSPDLQPPERMKRSVSHPGTYSFDRSSIPKECVYGGQRSTHRRNRTCSDSSVYDSDRVLSSPSLNGDSCSIPEERGCGVSPKTTPTDTDTDLSMVLVKGVLNAMEECKEDEGVDVQCTGVQSLQWDSIGLTGNSSTDVPRNNKSRSSPDFLGLSRCAACYDQRGRVEVDHESSTSSENSGPEFDWDSDEPDSSSDSSSVSSAGVPGEDWTSGSGTVTRVISQCENGMGSEERPQSHSVTQQGSSEEMKENMERQENPERIEGKRRAPLLKSLSLPSSLSFSLLPQPLRSTSTLQLQLPSQHKDVTFCTAPFSVCGRPTEKEEDKEMAERDGTRQERDDSQLSSPRATHQQHQYQEQQQLSLNQQQHCQQYRQQSPLLPHHVANQFFPLPPPPTPMFPLYTLMPPTYQHTSNHEGIHASHIHLHALIPPPYCCCYNKHRFLPHTHWTGYS